MKALIRQRGILGHLSRVLCLILSVGLVLIDFPLTSSLAQQIQSSGVPIEGQGNSQGTVPLLRDQERRYSEQECRDWQNRINTLSDPCYKKGLEKQLEPLRKLLDEAESDYESAKSQARAEIENGVKELSQLGWGKFREKWSKDLLKWRLEKIREKYGLETPAGVPAYKWLKFTKDLDYYSNKVEDYLGELDAAQNYLNDTNELRLRTQKAAGTAKDLQKSLRDLAKDAAESGTLNDLLDKAVLATPIPLDDLANSLGKLGIGLALTQMAKADRKRELEQARENFLPVLDRELRIDMDIDNTRWKYDRYCKVEPIEAEKLKAEAFTSGTSRTYYVATTGSNSNPGTEKQPWQTVAYAVSTMVAGDTTYVRGGTYNEAKGVWFKKTGTECAPIKLLNYPGEFPIIVFSTATDTLKRIILRSGKGANKPIGWITIEGFELKNGYDGIKFYNLHDSTIRRNWIHDNPMGAGISGNGTRVMIDRNIINHNAFSRPNHGIYANGTAFTITNNLFYDNYNYGIQLNGSSSSTYNPAVHAGPEFAVSADWIIANNTFAYNNRRAGLVVWGSTCNNLRVENNIFYENAVTLPSDAPQGIDFVSTQCTRIQIRNNLAFASGGGGMQFLGPGATEGVHYTQSGNIVNTDNPRFVNALETLPAWPNFALTERSPAIDAGLPLTMTRIAFDGTTRPQGRAYDIGAYEYRADDNNGSRTAPEAIIDH